MNQLDAGETSRTLWSFCLYNSLMDLLLMRQSLRPGLKLLQWSLLISATFFSSFFITDGTKWCVLVVNCFTCWCKWLRLMQTFFLVIALVRYDSWEKTLQDEAKFRQGKGAITKNYCRLQHKFSSSPKICIWFSGVLCFSGSQIMCQLLLPCTNYLKESKQLCN